MQKILTMFERDESQRGHPVIDKVKPDCQWVLDGEGVATVKWDGVNIKMEDGQMFKRQKPKDRDYDMASYIPCEKSNPSDKWMLAALEPGGAIWTCPGFPYWNTAHGKDAIYELVGPNFQGNPLNLRDAYAIAVLPHTSVIEVKIQARDFDALREFLQVNLKRMEGNNDTVIFNRGGYAEGLVFHHPDGRMAKIKRRDFGLPWPVKEESNAENQQK